jgi:flavin-dependent dehydrogenase
MGRRHINADVVVVGGGPAGSSAAIACALRGLRVMLFERDRFDADRPGETLHPGIEPLLSQLGVAERLRELALPRHRGIWIEWGGPRRFERFGKDHHGPWYGFQVRRSAFDRLLVTRAGEIGVNVRQPEAVVDVFCEDGEVRGVVTDEIQVTARMVVDASGVSRWFDRKMGVGSDQHSPKLLARYGYVEGHCPTRDDAPALVGDASGWAWTAKVWRDTYQWTRLTFDGHEPVGGWVPKEFQTLRPRGRMCGADVTWRLATRTAGKGWMLIGDAAAVLDPTSSHGVLKAIVSGMTAGHLVGAVLSGKAPVDGAADAYHEWLSRWFTADAAKLARFYRDLGVDGFG